MNKIYPYAGFWKRAIAFLIDGIVLAIPSTLISALLIVPQVMSVVRMASANVEPSPEIMLPFVSKWMLSMVFIWISNIVLLWLYSAWMESSKYQATLGKMALGIKVVGAHGERISFARATGRTFAKFISHMILYFGDYMAGFTEKRQALHDMIATTYVVTKDYQQGQELPALPFSKGGLIASILAALSPIVLYVGAVIITMALAVSEIKNDPDMQGLRNSFTREETPYKDPELGKLLNDSKRDLYLSTAQVEIDHLVDSHTILNEPVEKDGITYSQSLEGYKASFKDPNGNEYEVLQRPGDILICCLKGPNGKCSDTKYLYKPCTETNE